ncbi:MAG: PEP-utilizing enzyme [Patescibacteria group bacterium]
MNIFRLVSFILNPQKAINYANKFRSDPYTIGYLNEFFFKYISFGKSKAEVVKINEIVDQNIKTNNKLINALKVLRKIRKETKKINDEDQIVKNNKSFGVSSGIIKGTILNINSTKQIIPKNCIGVFPTSGVKYTTQFLKCAGIIFLNGSITSHGAILAREFRIPAIVFPNIKIANGITVIINGIDGSVKRLVDSDN